MSDKQELKVVVSGDASGAKRAFTELTSATQTLGKTVQQETASASQAAQAMGQTIRRTSEEAGRNWGEIGKGVQKVSLALGALTLEATAEAGKNEAAQQRLIGAFENSGQAIADYEEQIKGAEEAGASLAFNHRDIVDSIAKFESTTKDAGQALSDLALAEDIARGANMSLAEATNIVQGAEVGRFRGMLQLGIKLDETATKQDYLAAAQAKYAGASERFATTGAADFERWKNTAEEALVSVGTHLSAVQGPLLALSAGGTIFGELGRVMKETGLASKVFQSSLSGPIGLTVAAAAAGIAVYELTQRTSGWEKAAQSATNTTRALEDEIAMLSAGGSGGTASYLKDVTDSWSKLAATGADYTHQISDLNDQIYGLQTNIDARRSSLTSNEDVAAMDALQKQLDGLVAMRDALSKLALDQPAIDQIGHDIDELFKKPLNAEKAAHDIQFYFDEFNQGIIDQTTLVDYLNTTLDEWGTRYPAIVTNSTAAQAAFNAEMQKTVDMMNAQVAGLTQIPAMAKMEEADRAYASLQAYATISVAVAKSSKDYSDAARAQETSMGAIIEATNRASGAAQTEYLARQAAVSALKAHMSMEDDMNAVLDVSKAKTDAITAALQNYQQQLGITPQLADTHAAALAGHAQAAGTALGDTFRVAVSNTSQIGSQAQGVQDWAASLIGVKDHYTEINTLLAKGTIDQTEYNHAKSAENSILHNNAAIQRDVLKIQVDQAPIIARMTKAEREYLDQLAQEPAQQQMATLGYMDQAESARALELQQLALSAATGELGKSGEKTANSMITAAAEADPYLQAMLVDMGLISVGADGTITVNYGSVTDGKDEMTKLTDAIDHLADVIGGVNIDYSQATDATSAVMELGEHIGALDGATATVTTNLVTNNIVHNIGDTTGAGTATGRLGGIMSYARGGVIAELAEAGPELLHFAGGGTAWAMQRGIYNVPNYTYVTPASAQKPGPPAIHFHNAVINLYPQPGASVGAELSEWAYGASRG